MIRKLIAVGVLALLLVPPVMVPSAHAKCLGFGCNKGGAPLPALAAGLPWLVGLGGGVFALRRFRSRQDATAAE